MRQKRKFSVKDVEKRSNFSTERHLPAYRDRGSGLQSEPALSYGMTAPSSSLKIPKLVPMYQNKNFSKMKHILPAIQTVNQKPGEVSLIKK